MFLARFDLGHRDFADSDDDRARMHGGFAATRCWCSSFAAWPGTPMITWWRRPMYVGVWLSILVRKDRLHPPLCISRSPRRRASCQMRSPPPNCCWRASSIWTPIERPWLPPRRTSRHAAVDHLLIGRELESTVKGAAVRGDFKTLSEQAALQRHLEQVPHAFPPAARHSETNECHPDRGAGGGTHRGFRPLK